MKHVHVALLPERKLCTFLGVKVIALTLGVMTRFAETRHDEFSEGVVAGVLDRWLVLVTLGQLVLALDVSNFPKDELE